MIARAPNPPASPKPPLISEARFDGNTNTVVLMMSSLGDAEVASVKHEMDGLSENHGPGKITFVADQGYAQINIRSENLPELALITSKIMARRLTNIHPDATSETRHYATGDQMRSVLGGLLDFAEQRKLPANAIRSIKNIIDTVQVMESFPD